MQASPCAKQLPQQVSGKGLVAPISPGKVAVGNPILPADPCAGKTPQGGLGSAPSLPVTEAHLSCNPWQKAICSGGRAAKSWHLSTAFGARPPEHVSSKYGAPRWVGHLREITFIMLAVCTFCKRPTWCHSSGRCKYSAIMLPKLSPGRSSPVEVHLHSHN